MSGESMRSGLIAAGNWIVDHHKLLDGWPPQDALANIIGESWGNGGSPYNILKDLAAMGAAFPLVAMGLVGDDADGQRIHADCVASGIDVSGLLSTSAAATSYSDVMTDSRTGRRTFFHQRGANSLLAPEHFDFSGTTARMFHLGYLLLLDSLDTFSPEGLPHACTVFRRAREAGLMTSLDCVSENSDRFASVLRPVLPEIDLLFVNDFEAERLSGLTLRHGDAGTISKAAVEDAAQSLIDAGVRSWVVVHFPEAVFAISRQGERIWQPSLRVPAQRIKGTAGAGDAFAAGVLCGVHERWEMQRALELGVCAAAASLFDPSCSDGLLPVSDCLALIQQFGLRELPR